MRDIKFRAWNKVDKTMYCNAINNCKDTFDMVLKHPQIYEVMQYTGLKDKNSIEIYEGDILKAITSIGKIVFKDAEFIIEWIRNKDFFNETLKFHISDLEIIGNIYENPQLMEVTND